MTVVARAQRKGSALNRAWALQVSLLPEGALQRLALQVDRTANAS